MEKDRRKMGWITRGTLMIDGAGYEESGAKEAASS